VYIFLVKVRFELTYLDYEPKNLNRLVYIT